MNKIISRIFDDVEGGSNWSLKGNGIAPAHINSNLRHFGINKKYALHGNNADEAYASWREWDDIKDPLDFLSRYHAVVMKSLAEMSFGEAISSKWGVKLAMRLAEQKYEHQSLMRISFAVCCLQKTKQSTPLMLIS